MQDIPQNDHSLRLHFVTNMNVLVISLFLLPLQHVIGGISEQKCEEYAGLIRKKRSDADDLLSAFRGIHVPGKFPTTPGEYPHMVQLSFGNGNTKIWACGGTLISDQYVLTGAECQSLEFYNRYHRRRRRFFIQELLTKPIPEFPSLDTKVEWVKLGDKTNGFEEIKVKEIILHPDKKSQSLYNDIALLKLEQKIKFGKYIRPACLYTGEDNLENKTVTATGWGALRFGEYFSDDLMKVEMEVYSEDECKLEFSNFNDELLGKGIIETQMCTGGHEEKKALCLGDGGGPFQIKNQNYSYMYDIVGIVSFGYTCNFPQLPILATRVAPYVPWIESVVWPVANK